MPAPRPNPPRMIGVAVRVILITILVTLLSFAVSLLTGIIGTILVARVRGHAPNLTLAYRDIAFPFASVVCVAVFVVALVVEIKRYRQSKLLAQIERTG